jgi:hypothetical protein
METKSRASVFLFIALLLSTAGQAQRAHASQTQEKYRVRLATVPMDGGMRSTVAGSGSATAVLTGSRLVVDGTFEGLLSPATSATVSRGAAMGVRGLAFATLTVSKAQKGTLSGSIDLTPEQLESVKNGHVYVQISSEKAPDGNLWGWFVR